MIKTDKRADIMDVALNLIAERGFHDSPMSLIARGGCCRRNHLPLF